jgi:hypothetical protein
LSATQDLNQMNDDAFYAQSQASAPEDTAYTSIGTQPDPQAPSQWRIRNNFLGSGILSVDAWTGMSAIDGVGQLDGYFENNANGNPSMQNQMLRQQPSPASADPRNTSSWLAASSLFPMGQSEGINEPPQTEAYPQPIAFEHSFGVNLDLAGYQELQPDPYSRTMPTYTPPTFPAQYDLPFTDYTGAYPPSAFNSAIQIRPTRPDAQFAALDSSIDYLFSRKPTAEQTIPSRSESARIPSFDLVGGLQSVRPTSVHPQPPVLSELDQLSLDYLDPSNYLGEPPAVQATPHCELTKTLSKEEWQALLKYLRNDVLTSLRNAIHPGLGSWRMIEDPFERKCIRMADSVVQQWNLQDTRTRVLRISLGEEDLEVLAFVHRLEDLPEFWCITTSPYTTEGIHLILEAAAAENLLERQSGS